MAKRNKVSNHDIKAKTQSENPVVARVERREPESIFAGHLQWLQGRSLEFQEREKLLEEISEKRLRNAIKFKSIDVIVQWARFSRPATKWHIRHDSLGLASAIIGAQCQSSFKFRKIGPCKQGRNIPIKGGCNGRRWHQAVSLKAKMRV